MPPVLEFCVGLVACTLLISLSLLTATGCSWIIYYIWHDSWGK